MTLTGTYIYSPTTEDIKETKEFPFLGLKTTTVSPLHVAMCCNTTNNFGYLLTMVVFVC